MKYSELTVGMRILTEDTTGLRKEYRNKYGYVADIDGREGSFIMFDDDELNTNSNRQDRAMFILGCDGFLLPDSYVIQEMGVL